MNKEKSKRAIVAEVRRIADKMDAAFREEAACLQKAMKDGQMLFWIEWRALSYANALMLWRQWDSIRTGVIKMFSDDVSVDEVLARLKAVRDEHIREVMRADQTNRSTSVMGNALSDESIQVTRQVVGDVISGDSLSYLLYSFGVK